MKIPVKIFLICFIQVPSLEELLDLFKYFVIQLLSDMVITPQKIPLHYTKHKDQLSFETIYLNWTSALEARASSTITTRRTCCKITTKLPVHLSSEGKCDIAWVHEQEFHRRCMPSMFIVDFHKGIRHPARKCVHPKTSGQIVIGGTIFLWSL